MAIVIVVATKNIPFVDGFGGSILTGTRVGVRSEDLADLQTREEAVVSVGEPPNQQFRRISRFDFLVGFAHDRNLDKPAIEAVPVQTPDGVNQELHKTWIALMEKFFRSMKSAVLDGRGLTVNVSREFTSGDWNALRSTTNSLGYSIAKFEDGAALKLLANGGEEDESG